MKNPTNALDLGLQSGNPKQVCKSSPEYSLSICDALVWAAFEHFNGKISLNEMDPIESCSSLQLIYISG